MTSTAGPSHGYIDVHSHAILPIWLDALAKATGQPRTSRQINGVDFPEWSVDTHLAMMDASGIETSFLSWPRATAFLKGSASRELARAMNEEFASIIARYPTRFGAFAVLPLDDMTATIEEMDYALDILKLDGVSSTTNIASEYLGDDKFSGWFAEMNRRAANLFVHPAAAANSHEVGLGIHPSILEYVFDTTRMVTNLVLSGAKQRFPDIRIIATHAGGAIPFLASRISILEPHFGAGGQYATLTGQEVLAGISSFYFDLTASTAAVSLDSLRHLVPISRLLCGFDLPMMPSETVLPAQQELSDYSSFTVKEQDDIRRDNMLELFPRLARRARPVSRSAATP